jgi:alpha-acetolactate decarboxylase
MVSRIPNDIFQYSTVSALMGGLASSGPTASQLNGYGTHGIGTFTKMDGELLYLDGKAWQFTSDGRTRPAPEDVSLPFIQVTKFVPEHTTTVSPNLKQEALIELFTSAGPEAGGKNSFVPFTIKGSFKTIHLRVAGPQLYDGQPLGEVAKNARQWSASEIKGTIFGIMSPEWSQGISVAGVHCHFVSDPDENGEVKGGHVCDFEAEDRVEVSWAVTGRYHLGFPRGKEWEDLELATVDKAGIKQAEGSNHTD